MGVKPTDSWNNPFFYRLDKQYCKGKIPTPPNTGSNFGLEKKLGSNTYSLTGIDYYHKNNSRVIAIVLSCGASGIDKSKTTPPL